MVLLVLGLVVAFLTAAMETLARREVFPQWLCRKVLHLGAVGACAVAPLLLDDIKVLTLIVAVTSLLLFALVGSGMLFREDGGRRSWGIALFPLPYLALLLIFPEVADRWLIALPMLLLAVSDAFAAVVGTLFRTPSFTLTGDRKNDRRIFRFRTDHVADTLPLSESTERVARVAPPQYRLALGTAIGRLRGPRIQGPR